VRVRIGIDKSGNRDGDIDFVLSRFSRTEWSSIVDALAATPAVVRTIVCDGVMAAQSMFNHKVARD
jgi:peptidyl-tRNA hydrolase